MLRTMFLHFYILSRLRLNNSFRAGEDFGPRSPQLFIAMNERSESRTLSRIIFPAFRALSASLLTHAAYLLTCEIFNARNGDVIGRRACAPTLRSYLARPCQGWEPYLSCRVFDPTGKTHWHSDGFASVARDPLKAPFTIGLSIGAGIKCNVVFFSKITSRATFFPIYVNKYVTLKKTRFFIFMKNDMLLDIKS